MELSEDNPWWKDPEKIKTDLKISEWEESVIKWNPEIRRAFDFNGDLVYSLRGPRQTGKTTMLKLLVREFLEEGVSPWNIMYYAFDVESDPRDLVRLIKSYFDNTKTQRGKKRCYLFLDEVSSIKNWQKGIKRLWDQKRLENCTVIATGSHTVDLKVSTEKLPGRRGSTSDALDKVMLPMKFSEFAAIMDPELNTIVNDSLLRTNFRSSLFESLTNSKVLSYLENAQAYMSEINQCLLDYMLTGGIPKAVNQYASSKRIEEGIYTDHLNAILGDLNALNKSENTFKQMAENILKTVGWTSSWRSLKKNTDIGNESTVSQYVFMLENMFIISVMYQYNSEKKKATYQKEKKIHFQDPFYFHVLNSWVSNTESFDTSRKFVENVENQGRLAEGIVASHLIRLAFLRSQKKQMFAYSNHIYYWRYRKDNEVDLVYNDSMGTEISIEVKFQEKITKRDLDGVINFKRHTSTDKALLLTKDVLSVERECIMIPVSLFLLLI